MLCYTFALCSVLQCLLNRTFITKSICSTSKYIYAKFSVRSHNTLHFTVIFLVKFANCFWARSYSGGVLMTFFVSKTYQLIQGFKSYSWLSNLNVFSASNSCLRFPKKYVILMIFQYVQVTKNRCFCKVFWISLLDISNKVPTVDFLILLMCKHHYKLLKDIISCSVIDLQLMKRQKTRLIPK